MSDFIHDRMQALKIEVLDAGLNYDMAEETLAGLLEDPESAAHLSVLLDETLFQVDAIVREFRRRWPKAEETDAIIQLAPWLGIVELREQLVN